ncbi:MAG: hypothetical protein GVY05_00410 [Bacteroidetes bacterium]|jgi:hypothetical protein|nr:hypothetical protein [Bacteroidota bacterium]
MKTCTKITTTLLSLFFIASIISCSDDDASDNSGNNDLFEESSYEITIEGEGTFTHGEVAVEESSSTISGAWFENPDFNHEKLTCLISENQANDLNLNAVIMLENGSALDIGDAADGNINEDGIPETKLIIQLSNTTYLSKTGTIDINNLEIDPIEVPEVPGQTSSANYNMNFTGIFDIGETPDTEEAIEITADIKVFTLPIL